MARWQKSAWRQMPRIQMPGIRTKVHSRWLKANWQFPPLVFAGEVRKLKTKLAEISKGNAFLLQGGDYYDFDQFTADGIRDTFKVMLQMAIVLTFGAKVPVVKLGRIAGQFAKPRSSQTEIKNGVEPSYRGDIINELEFNANSRSKKCFKPTHNQQRL